MLSEEIDILNSKLKKISEKNDKMLLETLELTKENKELKNELSTVEIIDIVPITLVDTFYKVDTIYIKDTIYLNKKDLKKINR
jgi:hypothetical protein